MDHQTQVFLTIKSLKELSLSDATYCIYSVHTELHWSIFCTKDTLLHQQSIVWWNTVQSAQESDKEMTVRCSNSSDQLETFNTLLRRTQEEKTDKCQTNTLLQWQTFQSNQTTESIHDDADDSGSVDAGDVTLIPDMKVNPGSGFPHIPGLSGRDLLSQISPQSAHSKTQTAA